MKYLLTFLLLLYVGASFAQAPTYSNLDYVGNGNSKQMLDLYIPPGLTRPAPIIIYIHGGGWQNGSKGGALRFCDTLLAHGYIIADINYRLSGDSIFPAQIYDCKAAVRWLKAHPVQYNIDTCKVAVTGSSAGGHLASLVGTSGGVDSLEDFGLGSRGATSKVHAVISFYGPSDFSQMDANIPRTPPDSCTDPMIHNSPNSAETRLLGCQFSDCPDRVRKASPITYIDGTDPPFKIYHGTFDCTVPPQQSMLLDSVLNAAGVYTSLSLSQHVGHGFRPDAQQQQEMLAFLNAHLTGCGSTGVDDGEKSEAPYRFGLLQNYPNPFNPGTVISWQLSRKLSGSYVTLKVYNVLGVEVAVLVNEKKEPGTYSVNFSGANLASGTYFYRLQAGAFVQTKKFVLLK
ncbi:MAG: alpha/beta hydrolase fold domain-containing protein [Ignavibacteriaceae bacterium]